MRVLPPMPKTATTDTELLDWDSEMQDYVGECVEWVAGRLDASAGAPRSRRN